MTIEDTITIKSRHTDCGEWGGHFEIMKIYKTNEKLMLNFQKDTVNCPDPSLFKRRVIEEWTTELSIKNQSDIMHFFQIMFSDSFKARNSCRNSKSWSVETNNYVLDVTKRDCGSNWGGFEQLKKKITTANKVYENIAK